MPRLKLLFFALASALLLNAQDITQPLPAAPLSSQWSLQQCIDYALDHNNQVRASLLSIRQGELAVTEAKDAFLPNISASASQGFNFGRGLTAQNTYANRNTSNFQWGANLSLPLFQGLQDFRRLKVQKSTLQKLLLDNEATKDDVTLNVISQYLQVLYAKEVAASAAVQVGYSAYEVTRQQALVDNGKVPEADLLDAQAQAAQDTLQLVNAQNDVQTALVNLANLLQLPVVEGFDIQPLDQGEPFIPSPERVYADALSVNHSLLAARQNLRVAADNISLARAGYIPTLSFGASISSSYYTVGGMPHESFGDQMNHNFSTYLGFQLSIPLFDAFSTRNNVRRATLQQQQARLDIETRESELYKAIQLAYYQAVGARNSYLTSQQTIAKTRESFQAMREKYNLGRATPTEFEQAKTNLFRTEVTGIQSHYEYLLRHRILLFYQTNRP